MYTQVCEAVGIVKQYIYFTQARINHVSVSWLCVEIGEKSQDGSSHHDTVAVCRSSDHLRKKSLLVENDKIRWVDRHVILFRVDSYGFGTYTPMGCKNTVTAVLIVSSSHLKFQQAENPSRMRLHFPFRRLRSILPFHRKAWCWAKRSTGHLIYTVKVSMSWQQKGRYWVKYADLALHHSSPS